MIKLLGHGANKSRVIVSLCDYSGNWPRPFHEAGYTVCLFDLKHGDDVTNIAATVARVHDVLAEIGGHVDGVMMAPPCTHFTVSGAQYWRAKDEDGRTAAAVAIVRACLRVRDQLSPDWWVLENPVGRIATLVPEIGKPVYFDPYQFAHLSGQELDVERYTKKTGLWGDYNVDALIAQKQTNGGPIRVCAQGSWIQKLGGKSERTKELRSMTPKGLARAFYVAQSSDTLMRRAA